MVGLARHETKQKQRRTSERPQQQTLTPPNIMNSDAKPEMSHRKWSTVKSGPELMKKVPAESSSLNALHSDAIFVSQC